MSWFFSEPKIDKCIKRLTRKNNYSPSEYNRYKNLCKIVNNIQISDETKVVNDTFTELLHTWFNDNVIVSEISKHLRKIGVCVCKEMVIWKNFTPGNVAIFIPRFKYDKTNSRDIQEAESIDYEKYYNTQIQTCQNDIFAIPIRTYRYNKTTHLNMIVVKRETGKPYKLSAELFEPNGDKIDAKEEMTFILRKLFDSEIETPDDIHIIDIPEMCPGIYIQSRMKPPYTETCSTISFWYAINRLLNPYEDYETTYKRMNSYLSGFFRDPTRIMKRIILSFMLLLDIDEQGFIGDKRLTSQSLRDLGIQNTGTDINKISRGGKKRKPKTKTNRKTRKNKRL